MESETIIRRGRRYQHFVLFLVTSETMFAASFLTGSGEVLEFLRSGINWPLESLIITAILTILANLSVFYGLANRKMLYVNVGGFQHGLAGLYFAIIGLYYIIAGLCYLKDFTREGFPVALVLIGLEFWFFTVDGIIQEQVENMKNDPKSTSDTQTVWTQEFRIKVSKYESLNWTCWFFELTRHWKSWIFNSHFSVLVVLVVLVYFIYFLSFTKKFRVFNYLNLFLLFDM